MASPGAPPGLKQARHGLSSVYRDSKRIRPDEGYDRDPLPMGEYRDLVEDDSPLPSPLFPSSVVATPTTCLVSSQFAGDGPDRFVPGLLPEGSGGGGRVRGGLVELPESALNSLRRRFVTQGALDSPADSAGKPAGGAGAAASPEEGTGKGAASGGGADRAFGRAGPGREADRAFGDRDPPNHPAEGPVCCLPDSGDGADVNADAFLPFASRDRVPERRPAAWPLPSSGVAPGGADENREPLLDPASAVPVGWPLSQAFDRAAEGLARAEDPSPLHPPRGTPAPHASQGDDTPPGPSPLFFAAPIEAPTGNALGAGGSSDGDPPCTQELHCSQPDARRPADRAQPASLPGFLSLTPPGSEERLRPALFPTETLGPSPCGLETPQDDFGFCTASGVNAGADADAGAHDRAGTAAPSPAPTLAPDAALSSGSALLWADHPLRRARCASPTVPGRARVSERDAEPFFADSPPQSARPPPRASSPAPFPLSRSQPSPRSPFTPAVWSPRRAGSPGRARLPGLPAHPSPRRLPGAGNPFPLVGYKSPRRFPSQGPHASLLGSAAAGGSSSTRRGSDPPGRRGRDAGRDAGEPPGGAASAFRADPLPRGGGASGLRADHSQGGVSGSCFGPAEGGWAAADPTARYAPPPIPAGSGSGSGSVSGSGSGAMASGTEVPAPTPFGASAARSGSWALSQASPGLHVPSAASRATSAEPAASASGSASGNGALPPLPSPRRSASSIRPSPMRGVWSPVAQAARGSGAAGGVGGAALCCPAPDSAPPFERARSPRLHAAAVYPIPSASTSPRRHPTGASPRRAGLFAPSVSLSPRQARRCDVAAGLLSPRRCDVAAGLLSPRRRTPPLGPHSMLPGGGACSPRARGEAGGGTAEERSGGGEAASGGAASGAMSGAASGALFHAGSGALSGTASGPPPPSSSGGGDGGAPPPSSLTGGSSRADASPPPRTQQPPGAQPWGNLSQRTLGSQQTVGSPAPAPRQASVSTPVQARRLAPGSSRELSSLPSMGLMGSPLAPLPSPLLPARGRGHPDADGFTLYTQPAYERTMRVPTASSLGAASDSPASAVCGSPAPGSWWAPPPVSERGDADADPLDEDEDDGQAMRGYRTRVGSAHAHDDGDFDDDDDDDDDEVGVDGRRGYGRRRTRDRERSSLDPSLAPSPDGPDGGGPVSRARAGPPRVLSSPHDLADVRAMRDFVSFRDMVPLLGADRPARAPGDDELEDVDAPLDPRGHALALSGGSFAFARGASAGAGAETWRGIRARDADADMGDRSARGDVAATDAADADARGRRLAGARGRAWAPDGDDRHRAGRERTASRRGALPALIAPDMDDPFARCTGGAFGDAQVARGPPAPRASAHDPSPLGNPASTHSTPSEVGVGPAGWTTPWTAAHRGDAAADPQVPTPAAAPSPGPAPLVGLTPPAATSSDVTAPTCPARSDGSMSLSRRATPPPPAFPRPLPADVGRTPPLELAAPVGVSGDSACKLFPIFKRKDDYKRVFIVRHGESEFNAATGARGGGSAAWDDPTVFDAPLTARGRAQARELGVRLAYAGIPADALWCASPLSRAMETMLIAWRAMQEELARVRERERGAEEEAREREADRAGRSGWGGARGRAGPDRCAPRASSGAAGFASAAASAEAVEEDMTSVDQETASDAKTAEAPRADPDAAGAADAWPRGCGGLARPPGGADAASSTPVPISHSSTGAPQPCCSQSAESPGPPEAGRVASRALFEADSSRDRAAARAAWEANSTHGAGPRGDAPGVDESRGRELAGETRDMRCDALQGDPLDLVFGDERRESTSGRGARRGPNAAEGAAAGAEAGPGGPGTGPGGALAGLAPDGSRDGEIDLWRGVLGASLAGAPPAASRPSSRAEACGSAGCPPGEADCSAACEASQQHSINASNGAPRATGGEVRSRGEKGDRAGGATEEAGDAEHLRDRGRGGGDERVARVPTSTDAVGGRPGPGPGSRASSPPPPRALARAPPRAIPEAPPSMHLALLPEISEKLVTTGDVGRPPPLASRDFPELSRHLNRLPATWWYSPKDRPNCAVSRELRALEPQKNVLRRIAAFKRFLGSRRERVVVAFGHASYWEHFCAGYSGIKRERMKNCELRKLLV